jgi:hypothetical protein
MEWNGMEGVAVYQYYDYDQQYRNPNEGWSEKE